MTKSELEDIFFDAETEFYKSEKMKSAMLKALEGETELPNQKQMQALFEMNRHYLFAVLKRVLQVVDDAPQKSDSIPVQD